MMIQALKNAKLPTEYPLPLAIWIYTKRMGLFLIIVGVAGGVLLAILNKNVVYLMITVLAVEIGIMYKARRKFDRVRLRNAWRDTWKLIPLMMAGGGCALIVFVIVEPLNIFTEDQLLAACTLIAMLPFLIWSLYGIWRAHKRSLQEKHERERVTRYQFRRSRRSTKSEIAEPKGTTIDIEPLHRKE